MCVNGCECVKSFASFTSIQLLPVTVMFKGVVAGHCDQGSEGWSQGIEDLCGRFPPHLKGQQRPVALKGSLVECITDLRTHPHTHPSPG